MNQNCEKVKALLEISKTELDKVLTLIIFSILGFSTFLLTHAFTFRFGVIALILFVFAILYLVKVKR